MLYPYTCDACGPFEVVKSMADATRPEPCPQCGTVIEHQTYAAKRLNGYVGTESNWTGGKIIPQLHPAHPDYRVTSQRQMERVYKENGLNLETGKFVSEEAQIKATLPRRNRTGNKSGVISGVDQEN
jgi:putative FmdB family regulatory protein